MSNHHPDPAGYSWAQDTSAIRPGRCAHCCRSGRGHGRPDRRCSVNQQSEHRRVPGAALAAAALVSCLAAVYSLR